jgi:hypothetical protein
MKSIIQGLRFVSVNLRSLRSVKSESLGQDTKQTAVRRVFSGSWIVSSFAHPGVMRLSVASLPRSAQVRGGLPQPLTTPQFFYQSLKAYRLH